MKSHKYKIGDKVKVNELAQHVMPDDVNLTGRITEILTGRVYDYEVSLDDGSSGVFKEKELDLVRQKLYIGDIVNVGDERAEIIQMDYQVQQVEVKYTDGSYGICDMLQVERVDWLEHEKDLQINYNSENDDSDVTKEIMNILLRQFITKDGLYDINEETMNGIFKILDDVNVLLDRGE